MWNNSISLPRKRKGVQDRDGFVATETIYERNIPASFTDVTRHDEILAAQKGYAVSQNVEIMECNYNGEEYLIDESTGDIMHIRRVFRKDKSMKVVLSCERRQNGSVRG